MSTTFLYIDDLPLSFTKMQAVIKQLCRNTKITAFEYGGYWFGASGKISFVMVTSHRTDAVDLPWALGRTFIHTHPYAKDRKINCVSAVDIFVGGDDPSSRHYVVDCCAQLLWVYNNVSGDSEGDLGKMYTRYMQSTFNKNPSNRNLEEIIRYSKNLIPGLELYCYRLKNFKICDLICVDDTIHRIKSRPDKKNTWYRSCDVTPRRHDCQMHEDLCKQRCGCSCNCKCIGGRGYPACYPGCDCDCILDLPVYIDF